MPHLSQSRSSHHRVTFRNSCRCPRSPALAWRRLTAESACRRLPRELRQCGCGYSAGCGRWRRARPGGQDRRRQQRCQQRRRPASARRRSGLAVAAVTAGPAVSLASAASHQGRTDRARPRRVQCRARIWPLRQAWRRRRLPSGRQDQVQVAGCQARHGRSRASPGLRGLRSGRSKRPRTGPRRRSGARPRGMRPGLQPTAGRGTS